MKEPWLWYLRPWRHYLDFRGRSRRREYLIFGLGNVIAYALVVSLAVALFPPGSEREGLSLVAAYLFVLAALIPTLALTVRRLHDLNLSGAWALLMLVPVLNFFLTSIVFLFFPGTPGENRFGPPPSLDPRE